MKNKLIPLIYAASFAIYIGFGLVNFASDRIFLKEEMNFPLDQIKTENLHHVEGNKFVATTNDPQFIVNVSSDEIKLKTITYTLKQGGTGEKALYYKTDKQKDFSAKRCIVPKDEVKQTAGYILAAKNVNCVRLDIAGTEGETIELASVTLNYKPSLFDYFNFSPMAIAKFLAIPLLLASVIKYFFELYEFYLKKKKTE